jgi:hypothetical protein
MRERLWRRVCRKDSLRGKVARIVAPLLRSSSDSFAASCKKKAAPAIPLLARLRLSRIFRRSGTTADPDAVPLGRALLWVLFGVVLLVGLVLYFKYERVVLPLLT